VSKTKDFRAPTITGDKQKSSLLSVLYPLSDLVATSQNKNN